MCIIRNRFEGLHAVIHFPAVYLSCCKYIWHFDRRTSCAERSQNVEPKKFIFGSLLGTTVVYKIYVRSELDATAKDTGFNLFAKKAISIRDLVAVDWIRILDARRLVPANYQTSSISGIVQCRTESSSTL